MASDTTFSHHFFKILIGNFSHKLMIPPSFLKHLSSDLDKEIHLENTRGRVWRVEIEWEEGSGSLFLAGNGWSSFVEENGLREFEFLVFGYDGKTRLRVQVFGTSACERHAEILPQQEEKKKKRKHGRPKGSRNRKKLQPPPYRRAEIPEVEEIIVKTEEVVEDDDCEQSVKVASGNNRGGRRRRTEEANKLYTSDRPYFTARVSDRNNCQWVPVSFAILRLPWTKCSLVLRDAEERAWDVSYNPGGSRNYIYGGWPAFVRGNNLNSGDTCAFELMGPAELRVRVIRNSRVS